MNKIVRSEGFKRDYKRFLRKHPQTKQKIDRAIIQLGSDYDHPSLRAHKLGGDLEGIWSCSCGYDLRILFEIKRDHIANLIQIVLLTLGTHDEVY